MALRIAVELNWPDVEVGTFADALNAQVRLVRAVMGDMGFPPDGVRWVLTELRAASAVGLAEPRIVSEDLLASDVDRAIAASGNGYVALRTVAERPAYFNDEALECARFLSNLLTVEDAGAARLRFGDVTTEPTRHVAANVDEIVTGRLQSIGSIEGILSGVKTAKSGYEISIKDRIRHRTVQCTVPKEKRQETLDAFEQRVIIRGIVWSRKDGTPQRIEARTIEVVPPDDKLPAITDVRGILHGFRRADGE